LKQTYAVDVAADGEQTPVESHGFFVVAENRAQT
jgi:hypothetical protein